MGVWTRAVQCVPSHQARAPIEKGGVFALKKALKVLALAAAFVVVLAVPAFAQSTPSGVIGDVIDEATPYITALVGVVVTLFGLGLLITLARKAAAMAGSKVRKG